MNPIYRDDFDIANEKKVMEIMEKLYPGRWRHMGHSNEPFDLQVMLADGGMRLIEVKCRTKIIWPIWAERAKVLRLKQRAAQLGAQGVFLWADSGGDLETRERYPVKDDTVLYTCRMDGLLSSPMRENAGRHDRDDAHDIDACFEVARRVCRRHNNQGEGR